MNARLSLGAAIATLTGGLLVVGVMRALSIEHMDLSPQKLTVLGLGLPIVVTLLATRIASKVRSTDSTATFIRRSLLWGSGIGINYWCASGLVVGPLLGEVTSFGGLWLLWAVLFGANAGAASSAIYGRRNHVVLHQSKARTLAFRTIVILSALASASVIIPVLLMVISMFAG
jgi:hypothetical protein